MHIKKYYKLALLVPIILPLVFLVLMLAGPNYVSVFFILALYFAGAPYLACCIFSYHLIEYLNSLRKLRLLVWLTPFVIVLLAIHSWYTDAMIKHLVFNKKLLMLSGLFKTIAVYGLILGFFYCVLIEGIRLYFTVSKRITYENIGK